MTQSWVPRSDDERHYIILKKDAKTSHKRASWLAVDLITHNCALAQAIVANLYSFEEMLWLQRLDSEELIPLLEEKMKST
jgi:hypothetical protein